jgi:hypothetical protein
MKKILKIEENKIDDMEIKNEIDIFQKLEYPNIVGFIITEFYKYGESLCIFIIEKKYSEKQSFILSSFFLLLFIKILNQKI